jgi:hypothetical protein
MVKRRYSIRPSTLSAWDSTDGYIFAFAEKYPRMGENRHGRYMIGVSRRYVSGTPFCYTSESWSIFSLILLAALYHLDPSSDYLLIAQQRQNNTGLRRPFFLPVGSSDLQRSPQLGSFKDYVQSCLNQLIATSFPRHVECCSPTLKFSHNMMFLSLSWTRSTVKHVSIIGRRSPLEAAFTIKELREIINLPAASMVPSNSSLLTTPPSNPPTRSIPNSPAPPKKIMEQHQKHGLLIFSVHPLVSSRPAQIPQLDSICHIQLLKSSSANSG